MLLSESVSFLNDSAIASKSGYWSGSSVITGKSIVAITRPYFPNCRSWFWRASKGKSLAGSEPNLRKENWKFGYFRWGETSQFSVVYEPYNHFGQTVVIRPDHVIVVLIAKWLRCATENIVDNIGNRSRIARNLPVDETQIDRFLVLNSNWACDEIELNWKRCDNRIDRITSSYLNIMLLFQQSPWHTTAYGSADAPFTHSQITEKKSLLNTCFTFFSSRSSPSWSSDLYAPLNNRLKYALKFSSAGRANTSTIFDKSSNFSGCWSCKRNHLNIWFHSNNLKIIAQWTYPQSKR